MTHELPRASIEGETLVVLAPPNLNYPSAWKAS